VPPRTPITISDVGAGGIRHTVPRQLRAYDAAVDAAVLVPVKAFHEAKARLAPALTPSERERLARWMAERVLDASRGRPVYVACDDPGVRAWAEQHGATVLWRAGKGLNGAVNDSIATLGRLGWDHVVVCHGDLPRPTALDVALEAGTITLVPDRRDGGTNVLSLPVRSGFSVAYGPGSFRRHLAAALALGAPVRVVRHPMLALDLDTPRDLSHPLVKEALPTWLRTIPVNPTPLHVAAPVT